MSQINFPFKVTPSLGREDFIVTDSNNEAILWFDKWPDWPGGLFRIFPANANLYEIGSDKSRTGSCGVGDNEKHDDKTAAGVLHAVVTCRTNCGRW